MLNMADMVQDVHEQPACALANLASRLQAAAKRER